MSSDRAGERPDWVHCVRRERVDLKDQSWCGRAVVHEWAFVGAEHAAENGRQGGRLVACPACVEAIGAALRNGHAPTPAPSPAASAGAACGGCGETSSDRRCLGCEHPFATAPASAGAEGFACEPFQVPGDWVEVYGEAPSAGAEHYPTDVRAGDADKHPDEPASAETDPVLLAAENARLRDPWADIPPSELDWAAEKLREMARPYGCSSIGDRLFRVANALHHFRAALAEGAR